jgi:hypothetical protein
MATREITLAPCPTCSKVISVKAFTCTNCGLPITESEKSEMLKTAIESSTTNKWREWVIRVLEWTLSNASKVRDVILVGAGGAYILGFIIWSIHASTQDLGFLPVINPQYLAAGFAPILVFGFVIFCLYVEAKIMRGAKSPWTAVVLGIFALLGIAYLRACLVKVRVRMVLYTFSYEKAVSDRPFRH